MNLLTQTVAQPIRRRLIQLLLCFTSALLGCATPPASDNPDLASLPLPPMNLDRWQASGKASFALNEEAETARFVWQRTAADTETITLKGPFSLNAVTLVRRDRELWWQQEGEQRSLSDLEGAPAVTTALTSLPHDALGTWLLGYPPQENSWQVTVSEWQQVPPWRAPARVTIKSAGIEIKVIISRWELNPAT